MAKGGKGRSMPTVSDRLAIAQRELDETRLQRDAAFAGQLEITRERDEARAEVERLRDGWKQAWQDRGTFFDQSCKNLQRAEQAERERDEARAEAHDTTVLLIHRTRERDAEAENARLMQDRLTRVVAGANRLRAALVKVRAHTGYRTPETGDLVGLLHGLLTSIERIVDEALEKRDD